MVKESAMLMNGQTDFLDILFGDDMDGISVNGEVNFVVPQERQVDEFDQQLDQTLDMNALDELTFDLPDQGILDACGVEVTPLTVEQVSNVLEKDIISQPQHFLFDQTDITELEYLRTGSSVTDVDDLLSNATDVSNMSDFTQDSNLSPPPRTPSTAGSVTSIDSLVPVFVRQGLKQTIQNRRRAEGKGELKVAFEPPEPEKLTEEEEDRRIERREKNRLAAQKCRGKKRERADILEAETKKLEKTKRQMKIDIQKLLDERDHLMDIINVHSTVCPKMRAQSSSF